MSAELDRQREEEERLKRERYVELKLVMVEDLVETLRSAEELRGDDDEIGIRRALLKEHGLWQECEEKQRDKKDKKEKKEKKDKKEKKAGSSSDTPAASTSATEAAPPAPAPAVPAQCVCAACTANDALMQSSLHMSRSPTALDAYMRATRGPDPLELLLQQLSLRESTGRGSLGADAPEGTFINADGLVVERYVLVTCFAHAHGQICTESAQSYPSLYIYYSFLL